MHIFTLTLLTLRPHVTLQRVHLNLNAFVLPFRLSRLPTVNKHNGSKENEKNNGRRGSHPIRLDWKDTRLHELVLEVAHLELEKLTHFDCNHGQPTLVTSWRLEFCRSTEELGLGKRRDVTLLTTHRNRHVCLVTSFIQVLALIT